MSDGALALAELGQAVIVTPFTLLGAMTPVTMAAALVQQNAEALLGLSMIQMAFPGSPVIYGGFTSNVDMRSGAPTFGESRYRCELGICSLSFCHGRNARGLRRF